MNSYPALDWQTYAPLDSETFSLDSPIACRYCGERRVYIPDCSYIAEDGRNLQLPWFDYLLPCWDCRLWLTTQGDT